MKNLNEMGVQEMSVSDTKKVQGGAVGLIIVGCIALALLLSGDSRQE